MNLQRGWAPLEVHCGLKASSSPNYTLQPTISEAYEDRNICKSVRAVRPEGRDIRRLADTLTHVEWEPTPHLFKELHNLIAYCSTLKRYGARVKGVSLSKSSHPILNFVSATICLANRKPDILKEFGIGWD
jgi:hypothetical protein